MNARAIRALLALALQALALAALVLALAGQAWLDPRTRPRWLVLVDRSRSVPRAVADAALAEVRQAARAAGVGALPVIEFAARPGPGAAAGVVDASATDIEAALDAALAAHAQTPFDAAVMVSDGWANVGDTERALRALRHAHLPLQWQAVGRPAPAVRITEVLVPERARVGQPVSVAVQLEGQIERTRQVKVVARWPGGEVETATAAAAADGRATLAIAANRVGAMRLDVAVETAEGEGVLDARADAAVVDVQPRQPLLLVQGSGGALARSLQRGGWPVEILPAARLDSRIDALDSYRAVVLDDVAISDAGPRLWTALVAAVRERGLGLVVLGGERSFARGGYRGSTLESVLPLLTEPAALDQPAAVVFVVDKSGSMGQGSGGVDRFQLARRAVVETARGLSERDALGLVVFDVEPRLLLPLATLGPAATGLPALERDWPVSPNGGTRIAPALALAAAELEKSPASRRLLVLVTDGFIDAAPLAELRARLQAARIETLALAVGPDADAAALERVFGADRAQVLRVNEAAQLPAVMRAGVERRRARVERGAIQVLQREPLPFAPGTFSAWPDIAAYQTTRAQPGASVVLQSRRGDPLIAYQPVGRGRVVAVASGLGAWTPRWLAWRDWPRLAGGLAEWAAGAFVGGAISVQATDGAVGLQVQIDLAQPASGAGRQTAVLAVKMPTSASIDLPLEPIAPNRLRARLPEAGPGLYTLFLSSSAGTQRQLHLRQAHAEQEAWGVNPAVRAWRQLGLVRDADLGDLARARPDPAPARPLDRSLIGLALLLFAVGVLVDRARLRLLAWPQRVPRS